MVLGGGEDDYLQELKDSDYVGDTLARIVELSKRVFAEKPTHKTHNSAYLVNMAVRLRAMKRVLQPYGSIVLHCDETAGHYLKMLMDAIFGNGNFRNEIIWFYNDSPGRPETYFPKKHDTLFWYSMHPKKWTFNDRPIRIPIKPESKKRYESPRELGGKTYVGGKSAEIGKIPEDVWPLPVLKKNKHKRTESLGYPTQKPLRLLNRIVAALSNEGDYVFDPFCGCGTTVHSAEDLNRKWLGIDIAQFSIGLVRNRITSSFPTLDLKDINTIGCPITINDAIDLATRNKLEFEKWVCGEIGAEGMFHEPGSPGPDGGVDGLIPFYFSDSFKQEKAEKTFAIVQVKGGHVTPDAVKALSTTVRNTGGKCGVIVCFEKYMTTVNNNREKKTIKSFGGDFEFIQPLSVEDLLKGKRPNIPGLPLAA